MSSAVSALQGYLQNSDCASQNLPTNLFARSGDVLAGVFVGSQVEKKSASGLLAQLLATPSVSGKQVALQLCDMQAVNFRGTTVFGLYVDTTGSLSNVQQQLMSWNNGTCLTPSGGNSVCRTLPFPSFRVLSFQFNPLQDQATRPTRLSSCAVTLATYSQAQSGDTCSSLALACGITLQNLEDYNGGSSFCDNLQSAGTSAVQRAPCLISHPTRNPMGRAPRTLSRRAIPAARLPAPTP